MKSQLELLFSSLNSNVEKIELFIALSKSSTPAMLSDCLGALWVSRYLWRWQLGAVAMLSA